MNIKINYGTGVATLPTAALAFIDRATRTDVKLLFLLCAEPFLLCGENRDACLARISERSGFPIPKIEASLAFWRGAGVLDMEDAEESPAPVKAAPIETPPVETPTAPETPNAPSEPDPAQESAAQTVTITRAKTRMLDEITNYSADEIEKFLAKQADAANYMEVCQEVWGGMFNQREYGTIISLVDAWGLSWNYVINLLAYANRFFKAKENQGKSIAFVHRLAMNYYKEGITTEEALQQKFLEEERMKDFEQRIRKIFGLGGRSLSPNEKKFFSTWLYEYKYNIEIVEMAYNITIDAKGTPNIRYINGILKKWYEDGYATLEEIIAKQERDNGTVKRIKEGSMTPDNARETVEGILAADPVTAEQPRTTNIASDINIIRRLLNLGNRMLTDGETAAFTKWRADYAFRFEIIYHAYQITLENRREYHLSYMDAILTKWHNQNLTTMEAIRAYEKGFREDKQRRKPAATANSPAGDGSFATEDFFSAAVKRSFGEDFDPAILNQ